MRLIYAVFGIGLLLGGSGFVLYFLARAIPGPNGFYNGAGDPAIFYTLLSAVVLIAGGLLIRSADKA